MISTTTPLEPVKIKAMFVILPDFIKTWFYILQRHRQISLHKCTLLGNTFAQVSRAMFEMTTFAKSFDIPRLWKMYHTVLSMTLKNSLQPTFVKKEQAQSGGVFWDQLLFCLRGFVLL